jgi:hypothetical protein
MKLKLLILLSLIYNLVSYAQTKTQLSGRITSEFSVPLNVEIINISNKSNTVTNEKGEFVIQAKANDSLYIHHKDFFLKKVKLTADQIKQPNAIFTLVQKPQQLDEVIVFKAPNLKLSKDTKYEQQKSDELALIKRESTLKTGVYDGTIPNGMDFNKIGELIIGLFVKEKEKPKPKKPQIPFTELAKKKISNKFYMNTLKLNPNEIDPFLKFCELDPKCKTIDSETDPLTLMDFLTQKNVEFQQINRIKTP